jgi:hypothetical protein
MWHQWKSPGKPWIGYDLLIDSTDEVIFTIATKVMVHNRLTTKFWSSSWLQGGAPALMFPDLFEHSRRKNRTVANAMRNDNWIADVMHNATPNILLLQYTFYRYPEDRIPRIHALNQDKKQGMYPHAAT